MKSLNRDVLKTQSRGKECVLLLQAGVENPLDSTPEKNFQGKSLPDFETRFFILFQ